MVGDGDGWMGVGLIHRPLDHGGGNGKGEAVQFDLEGVTACGRSVRCSVGNGDACGRRTALRVFLRNLTHSLLDFLS
uniref:Uncharacterized protein n=3 Tax=Oryza TaxID=4527 RepID=Q2R7W7_ORYSJ|nr:hypothetical protein LOC_Os11g14690 [Oryza sativa Japonica Group]ABA92442.1 hypothetical protein LOC_Os11g14690 [Oryza sativa Japonica Group]